MTVMELIQDHTDDDTVPILQRRYLLCELQVCLYHNTLLIECDMVTELSSALLTDILRVSVQTRKYRMKSLFYLWKALSPHNPNHIAMIVSSLPQLVLCIKDANMKIRSICFEIILLLSTVMEQADCLLSLPDGSTTKASLTEFCQVLIGCLTVNTAHMKSASLMCISVVFYHHRDKAEIRPILVQLTQQVCEMLVDKSRELAKSCFGFLRTAVKIMNEEELREQMPLILTSILPWVTNMHNRFPLRVKAILEVLVRRLGKDDVEKAMPHGKETMLESILKNEKIREKKMKEDEEKDGIDEDASELEISESEEEFSNENEEENNSDDNEDMEMEEDELNTLTQNNEEVIEMGDQKEDLTSLLKEIADNENLKKAVKRRKEWEYGTSSVPSKKRK